jgi:hypothetical protein
MLTTYKKRGFKAGFARKGRVSAGVEPKSRAHVNGSVDGSENPEHLRLPDGSAILPLLSR